MIEENQYFERFLRDGNQLIPVIPFYGKSAQNDSFY